MISLINHTRNLILRKLFRIPRFAAYQIVIQVANSLATYMKRLDALPLDEKTFNQLVDILTDENLSDEGRSNKAKDLITNFFLRNNFTEPNPFYEFRYHLATCTEAEFMYINTEFEKLMVKFSNDRNMWVKQHMQLAFQEIQERRAATAALQEAEKDLDIILLDKTPGES